MKTKAITTIIVALFLGILLNAMPILAVYPPDVGAITLDDTTTFLHYYDAGTTPEAWAWGSPNGDLWYMTIATSYDAKVRIEWFDFYDTDDVYELYIDGVLKGTNDPDEHGVVDVLLSTGTTYEVRVDWKYYQGNQPPTGGGSWYDITFTVLRQYIWFKASGGGVSTSDVIPTQGHFCTLGVIGMSLETTTGIGPTVPYVLCKGSGTFIDHDSKIKLSFDIIEGGITRGDKMIWFYGTAKIFDIEDHAKYYDIPVRVALVDDQYGGTNRFDVETWGNFPMHWHGTLLPNNGEVTVWVWQ